MNRTFYLLAASLFALLAFAPQAARAEVLYALTNSNLLLSLDSDSRQVISATPITGLGGDNLLAIDFRPATGELYGFSSGNQFYKINTGTGASSTVGNPLSMIAIVKSFDFDPVTDRMRVQSNLRNNIQVNPNTGVPVANTLLNYNGSDPNAGSTPQVVALAYTNSFPGATSSTLYNLEALNDVLTNQTPQNAGTLNTVGSLGVPLGTLLSVNGMDISGTTGIGYVVGSANLGNGMTPNTLYTIDLASGAIELAGQITNGPNASPLTGGGGHNPKPPVFECPPMDQFQIIDVAALPAVPEPSSIVLGGIGALALAGVARSRRRARK